MRSWRGEAGKPSRSRVATLLICPSAWSHFRTTYTSSYATAVRRKTGSLFFHAAGGITAVRHRSSDSSAETRWQAVRAAFTVDRQRCQSCKAGFIPQVAARGWRYRCCLGAHTLHIRARARRPHAQWKARQGVVSSASRQKSVACQSALPRIYPLVNKGSFRYCGSLKERT